MSSGTTFMEKRGKRKRYYAYRYDKLEDGCHASDSLSGEWAAAILKAISYNIELEDSEDEDMPKRARGWSDD